MSEPAAEPEPRIGDPVTWKLAGVLDDDGEPVEFWTYRGPLPSIGRDAPAKPAA